MHVVMIKSIVGKLYMLYTRTSAKRYVSYLRKKGVAIGRNFAIRGGARPIRIDVTRPSLITIGDNVTINKNFTIMTHDFVSGVFLNKYSDFVPSSGRVVIGNNVRFGIDCTVLKGVTIGDNCFIAAGAIVTRDIPSGSIAGGIPAKVLCTLDDYYQRRKEQCVKEAFEYARSIQERYHRKPIPEDFWEEFPLFVDAHNIDKYPMIPIKRQLGNAYDKWLKMHKAQYDGFDEFLEAALE